MPYFDDVEALEQALVAQWSNFGEAPGGKFNDNGYFAWIEAPVSQIPYNAVVRTKVIKNADSHLDALVKSFTDRKVQFIWVVHPTAEPKGLEDFLIKKGLTLAGIEVGMVLGIGRWKAKSQQPKGNVQYIEVSDDKTLRDFEELITLYWDLPEQTKPYVHNFTQWAYQSGKRGKWLLAYMDNEPVGKAYLSLRGVHDTASIWGVYVKPAARGLGIASILTEWAITKAAEAGKTRVVLAATEMGINMYRRIGFKETKALKVYASTAFPSNLQALQPL